MYKRQKLYNTKYPKVYVLQELLPYHVVYVNNIFKYNSNVKLLGARYNGILKKWYVNKKIYDANTEEFLSYMNNEVEVDPSLFEDSDGYVSN